MCCFTSVKKPPGVRRRRPQETAVRFEVERRGEQLVRPHEAERPAAAAARQTKAWTAVTRQALAPQAARRWSAPRQPREDRRGGRRRGAGRRRIPSGAPPPASARARRLLGDRDAARGAR